uniref:DRBM domain-containing protein n=1 Tax=Zooxanthella nutricula TaxID=1333877 RepID=A0A7S2QGQ9_9DINO
MAPPQVHADPKSTLNMFAQKYCKKMITKEDISYSTISQFGEHQSTVTVNCLEGVQFAGEVASTAKDAEKSAATVALQHFAEEVALALAQPSKNPAANKKRKAPAAFGGCGGLADGSAGSGVDVPGTNAKQQLNTLLMRVLKRALTKDDVDYSTAQTGGGFQTTLSMPCLEGEYAGLQWAGELATKKKVAEENAANQAVQTLTADPVICAALAAPSAKAARTHPPPVKPMWQPPSVSYVPPGQESGGYGKGKGKGKDKGKGKWKGKDKGWGSFGGYGW